MEKSYSASYAAAGVDITAGYRSVELMKQYVARTMTESCIGGLGGFGGLFELDCTGMEHPVLISGTDGVGTKLRIAMLLDKHDTIGIDCVAMCVNDVICAGAKPLVFLDYIACGKNIPEKIAEIVKGVAEGCVQAGCSLVGGETAEHPGMMPEDEYDLAGFTVGVVDKAKILDNSTMQPGDVIIALPSTGVHSNGFSLVRKIFDIDGDPAVLKTAPAELGGKTLGMIGCGRISQLAMKKCKYGFGMKVIGYDTFLSKEQMAELGVEKYDDKFEALKAADVVIVQMPLIEGVTNNTIAKAELDAMKPTALLINCSRGEIVNEPDLCEALKSGSIAGAGLDVFWNEPTHIDDEILHCPNVIASPHSAAQTREAVIKMAKMCVNGCLAVVDGKKWPYVADLSLIHI